MRHLVIVLALVATAACAAGFAVGCPATPASPDSTPMASGIDLTTFDQTVRPQDDLFHHTNGVWLAKTEIPADKSSYGSFDLLVDKTQADLRAIVEDAAKSATRSAGSEPQKIGDFYVSFMNETRAEEIGLKPLEIELAAIDEIW